MRYFKKGFPSETSFDERLYFTRHRQQLLWLKHSWSSPRTSTYVKLLHKKSTDLFIKLLHKKSADLYIKLLHKKSSDLYIKLLQKSLGTWTMADHSSLAGLDKSSGMIDWIFKIFWSNDGNREGSASNRGKLWHWSWCRKPSCNSGLQVITFIKPWTMS